MGTGKRKQGTPHDGKLHQVHRCAAGIDVGSTMHVVAVPRQSDSEPVRTFGTFTGDLQRLADWLVRVGVTTVAMESTGVYWYPFRLPRS